MRSPPPVAQIIARVARAAAGADRNHAINLAVEALKRGVGHPLVWSLVAEGLEAQGRRPEAVGLLRRAVAAAPGDPALWFRLGRLLFALDRREAALDALKRGLALSPGDYGGLFDAGTAHLRLGDLAAAAECFRRAAVAAPDRAEPLSALAVAASLDGDAAGARDAASRALALDGKLVSAHIALARADALDGHLDLAEGRLTRLLAREDLGDGQRADAHDLRAEGLDAQDRPAAAFADYTARNDLLRRLHAPRLAAAVPESQHQRARRLAAAFAATPVPTWRAPAGPDGEGARLARGHVFLMGFPRSGTTLLEKALAGHPHIIALEEIDALGAAGNHLLAGETDLARLARLPDAEAGAARGVYWRAVAEALGQPIAGRILIDKMPLHTPAMPPIARLFPDARILFALRDPRDVVFSCFRRHFRVNAAMFEFLTLEGAAAYYDTIMDLAALYRRRLPLAVHEVRHEAVVADFDGQLRQVLDFIGAPWNPDVRTFPARARASVRTPSAPQLARGLNADGVGQWRRYRAQLVPVLPVLAPWVERFGYDPD